jgi:hypothetical protein
VTAQFKEWNVFAGWNARIVGSNPTRGMDVCIVYVYSVFVLSCVYLAALRQADSPSKESYSAYGIKKLKKQLSSPKGCTAIIILIIGSAF